MESRHSGRADGRGWGGRGDSGPRRGASRGDPGPEQPEAAPAPDPDVPVSDDGPGIPSRGVGGSAEAPPSLDDDILRGAGETPWVRAGEPRAHGGERPGARRAGPPLPDLSALLVALEGMRGMVPSELRSQVNALIREVLLTLRALIDWYLERLEPRQSGPEVEEIPID
jgi:hypothetical protein